MEGAAGEGGGGRGGAVSISEEKENQRELRKKGRFFKKNISYVMVLARLKNVSMHYLFFCEVSVRAPCMP